MILTCDKCGRKHPLSEDDVAFFYPRFMCLSCGTRLEISVEPKTLAELGRMNDRDRRVPDTPAKMGEETVRHIRPGLVMPPDPGTDGG